MGPVNSPPIPLAWRERPQSPISPKQLGLELIGRNKQDGTPAIYWAPSYEECFKAAETDGWKL